MKLILISTDNASAVGYDKDKPEVTKWMKSTLSPICLAHEIAHIRLGHITKEAVAWRYESYNNLILQELACWQYVFALNTWSIKDMQFAFTCLDATIRYLRITTITVLTIYREFKDEYLPNS